MMKQAGARSMDEKPCLRLELDGIPIRQQRYPTSPLCAAPCGLLVSLGRAL